MPSNIKDEVVEKVAEKEIEKEAEKGVVDDEIYVAYRPVVLSRKAVPDSAWENLGQAIARVGHYSAWTLAIGVFFMTCAFVASNATIKRIFEHLATAALASAIVVFIIEWKKKPIAEDRPWRERLARAIGEVGFYCAVGLLVSAALWTVLAVVPLDTHVAEIFNHIAGAFFVSAIVIFGYEWGSEAKRASDMAASLVQVLYGHIDRVLDASSRYALQNSMAALIGPHAKDLTLRSRPSRTQ